MPEDTGLAVAGDALELLDQLLGVINDEEMVELGINAEQWRDLVESRRDAVVQRYQALRDRPSGSACIVVTWDEPESGIAVYGAYATEEEARANIPKIEPYFVNPFASEEEAQMAALNRIISAEACEDMGYEWGGVIPEGVEFEITTMDKP